MKKNSPIPQSRVEGEYTEIITRKPDQVEEYQEHYYVPKKPEKTVRNLLWVVVALAIGMMIIISVFAWIILSICTYDQSLNIVDKLLITT